MTFKVHWRPNKAFLYLRIFFCWVPYFDPSLFGKQIIHGTPVLAELFTSRRILDDIGTVIWNKR